MCCGIARFFTAAAMTALLGACDQKPMLGPSEDPVAVRPATAAALASWELTSNAVSPGQIDLAWHDNSRNETGFEVHRATTVSGGAFIIVGTAPANAASYTDAELTAETQYCYMVRAFRTSARKTSYSDFSNASCATAFGPPLAPLNLNATPASSSAIDITWTDQSTAEDGFRVERSATSAGPRETLENTGANVTSIHDQERPSEQQVCYRVIAFNGHGISPSNVDCTSPPAAPTNLAAISFFAGIIELSWADNSAVEDGCIVQRSTDGVIFTTLDVVPPNSSSYYDFAATGGMTYWYRVRTRKDGGFSDFSNVASAAPVCESVEYCYNGIDDDCDGLVDEDCTCDHEGCGAE